MIGSFSQFAASHFTNISSVALAFAAIRGAVFWPYFTGAALLVIGLIVIIKNELPKAHGLDKLLPFGRLCFAVPMAIFGSEHFVFAQDLAPAVPSWIPAHLFWVYLVGVALIAASLSIIVRKQSRLAATLLGIMLFLFVVLISVPRVLADPRDRFSWAVGLRDLAFSGGAFAFAGSQTKARAAQSVPLLTTLGRLFIAVAAIFFGVEHFLHPTYVPAVPLDRLTPTSIPGHLLWAYLVGVVLLGAGACLIANKSARLAAAYLGLAILVIVFVIYLPMLVAEPASIGNGLNYFVDTLAFGGAVLLLSDALPKEGPAHA